MKFKKKSTDDLTPEMISFMVKEAENGKKVLIKPCQATVQIRRLLSKIGSRFELATMIESQSKAFLDLMSKYEAKRSNNYQDIRTIKASLRIYISLMRLYWTLLWNDYEVVRETNPFVVKQREKKRQEYKNAKSTVKAMRREWQMEKKRLPIMSSGVARDVMLTERERLNQKNKNTRMRNKIINSLKKKKDETTD